MDYMSTVIPVLMAFAISVVLCPIIIPFLKKMKFGQYIRDSGIICNYRLWAYRFS